jgi:hypothetical protein
LDAIQDADEFYSTSSWHLILQALANADSSTNLIKTTWYNFWKHPSIVVVNRYGSIKTNNAGFALRITPDSFFVDKRHTCFSGGKVSLLLDAPCYHYGYVLNDEEMALKLSSWGHVSDFYVSEWYSIKWKKWNFQTKISHQ